MSLILDALKKIERDKRRAGDGAGEMAAVSHSTFNGRSNWLSMGAMAVGSALLTTAAVSLLNDRNQGSEVTPEETSSALIASSVSSDPESDTPQLAVSPVPRAEMTPAVEPARSLERAASSEASPPSLEPSRTPEPEAEDPSPQMVDSADDSPALAAPNERAEPDEPDESDEPVESVEANEPDEVSQPIRLVGRERALLNSLNLVRPSESSEASTEDELPPEDFPKLVLQGTSVIGGTAVAVISDQRVFEGDRIEGAVVVRIGEREVELEVEGKRFKLRL